MKPRIGLKSLGLRAEAPKKSKAGRKPMPVKTIDDLIAKITALLEGVGTPRIQGAYDNQAIFLIPHRSAKQLTKTLNAKRRTDPALWTYMEGFALYTHEKENWHLSLQSQSRMVVFRRVLCVATILSSYRDEMKELGSTSPF